MTHDQAIKLANRIEMNGLSKSDIETINKAAAIAHAEASRLDNIFYGILSSPEADPWDVEEAQKKAEEAREQAYLIEHAYHHFRRS